MFLCLTAHCAGGRGYIAAGHPLVDKDAGASEGGAAGTHASSARLIRYQPGLKLPYKARQCGHMRVYRVVCLDKAGCILQPEGVDLTLEGAVSTPFMDMLGGPGTLLTPSVLLDNGSGDCHQAAGARGNLTPHEVWENLPQ